MSRATRGVMRALAMLGSAQGVAMICSLLRNKLIAVVAGQAGIALIGILNAAVEMTGAIAQQGLRTSAVGPVATAAPGPAQARVASSVTVCGLATGLISGVAMLIASPWLSELSFGSRSYTWAFAAVAAAVVLNAFTASRQAIAQGTGALGRIARASLIGSTGGLALSVPLILWLGADGLPWVIVVYSAVTAAAYFAPVPPRSPGSLRHTLADGFTFLRLGIWLTLSSVVDWGVSYLFMSWLSHEGGAATVGLYQSGYTVAIRYMGILFSVIALEFYPRLAVRAERGSRHSSLVIAHEAGVVLRLAVPAAMLLVIAGPWVIRLLYSGAFDGAFPFMAGALAATPLRALAWCVAFLMIARRDGRAYLLVELASGATCLVLSALLYHACGLAGVGAAYVIWYALYLALVLVVCRRRYHMSLPPAPVVGAILSAMLLSATAWAAVKIY